MKKFYQLTLTISDEGTRSNMTVGFSDLQSARTQLDMVTSFYQQTWKVPVESNDEWHVFEVAGELRYITFSREANEEKGIKSRYFSGALSELPMLEANDMIQVLPGTVFKSKEQPNIFLMSKSVMLQGDTRLETGFAIDVEKCEPVEAPAGNVDMASFEEAKTYYAMYDEICKQNVPNHPANKEA